MQIQAHILISIKRMVKKILNLKLVIMEEYQNIKKKIAKDYIPNWSDEIKWSQKLKTLFCGHVTSDFKSE